VESLIGQYPWMPTLAPVFGIGLGWARHQGWLEGFGLLGTAFATAVVVVGGFGLLHGWGPHEWLAFPGTIVLLLGESNVTGSTFSTLLERFGLQRAGA
jgi:hypothetical protein